MRWVETEDNGRSGDTKEGKKRQEVRKRRRGKERKKKMGKSRVGKRERKRKWYVRDGEGIKKKKAGGFKDRLENGIERDGRYKVKKKK